MVIGGICGLAIGYVTVLQVQVSFQTNYLTIELKIKLNYFIFIIYIIIYKFKTLKLYSLINL